MAFFDFPYEKLITYLPDRNEPADFDEFWANTLSETRQYDLNPKFESVDFGLTTIDTYDVTFCGYAGQPIKGWLILPKNRKGKIPCVVEYIGYSGGRGFPIQWLLWSAAGYAHLVMDTRGQGSGVGSHGDTPDPEPEGSNPHVSGFMTRGILSPKSYFYRRVFVDAVRAVETACSHPEIDASRIAATGGSQGGGITLAASGLEPRVKVCMPDVPFLCHYRRATQIINNNPYVEISNYCKSHRDKVEQVFKTLSYFDGVNFAARSRAKSLFSVGLMDDICPPSTVYAAYNHYMGEKEIKVYEYNNHEGGGQFHQLEKVRFLKSIWAVS